MAKSRLSNAIVVDYMRRIGSHDIEPGTPLPPESALCREYGVGRSVVRDALQALDAKGFVIVRQGSVAVVAPRHRWHVLDKDFLDATNPAEYFPLLQEARELLEPALARIAAARISDHQLTEMVALNTQLAAQHEDPERHAELDIAFHDALARATDNVILVSLHSSITGLGQHTRIAAAAVPGAIDRAVFWHEQIIDALRAGDATGASSAMHLHLTQVREDLRTTQPGHPEDPGEES
ncbi:FadR/GntR family transcriptional regulator [Microbacterium aquimaris]|uniref:FCD domain-containing protein n=1 Tax=Microbacterium aquimaris TaxID=459816 RepID=A0ABU5N7K8_9MICO|nr:FCD domain-containing protein [Microbacterium aquimaris]MDZ8162056.1 FCD domain-containing protein [Microbacterium aquimaris]